LLAYARNIATNKLTVYALTAIHFGAPLAYYAAARRWLKTPWRIKPNPAYTPAVTVAIPTYNETRHMST
jgi:cellulose synthase/poly-beta-1,6-N-acetylglucosamine synthase-like glycosyltransferase